MRNTPMLITVGIILLVLWLFGFVFHFLGNIIHILLIIAIIVFLVRIIQGRNPLK